MEGCLGLLRIYVKKGINLAVRDATSSDPYCVVTMGSQKLKTRVVKDNCNPEWDDSLTLTIQNLDDPIILTVYDKDTFTKDDQMGDAVIDIKPYLESIKLAKDIDRLPEGCALKRVQPTDSNCLADESNITWNNGKISQEMLLKLRKAESGKVLVSLEWINALGCIGLDCYVET